LFAATEAILLSVAVFFLMATLASGISLQKQMPKKI
jgi:hypothetical protein